MIQDFFVWLIGPDLSVVLLAVGGSCLLVKVLWKFVNQSVKAEIKEESTDNKHPWRG